MKSRKIDKIAAELRRIAKRHHGVLQPEDVVSAARDKKSPLHSRFEWDDNEAARNYRIWQARQLIRVCVEQLPGIKAPSEVFVSLSPDRYSQGGYRVVTDVLSDKQMREVMLEDALAELEIFRLKYRRLTELVEVFSAIKKVSRQERRGLA